MESAAPTVGGKKKARMESDSPIPPTPNVRVKQEAADQETHLAAAAPTPPPADESPAAAAAAAARVEVPVRIDAAILHCPPCLLPLKPPIFQCVAGHLACGVCHAKLTDVHCQACGDGGGGGGAYAHNPALDAIARSTKIRCPNDRYGCDRYVTYCDVADHQRACPHAPCTCPQPGCGFLAAPPALLDHLTADHPWPVTQISYAKPCKLAVPLPRRCHVLVGEDDRAVFLLVSPSPCGVVGAAVCVACVRANGDDAAAQYKCKLWVEVPTNSDNMVMMTSKVRSSDLSGGFPAAEHGMFLVVPLELLHEVSGETPILRIRIDRAAAAIAKPTTPRARSQRRLQ